MASAPEELSSIVLLWSVPPDEPFPPEQHGKPVVVVAGCYSGSVEEGEAVVQPLRELNDDAIAWGRAFWDAIGEHSTGPTTSDSRS
jgi:hypothetical protein